jgi:hypothetical protein
MYDRTAASRHPAYDQDSFDFVHRLPPFPMSHFYDNSDIRPLQYDQGSGFPSAGPFFADFFGFSGNRDVS